LASLGAGALASKKSFSMKNEKTSLQYQAIRKPNFSEMCLAGWNNDGTCTKATLDRFLESLAFLGPRQFQVWFHGQYATVWSKPA
jgi:hypothetical protein